MISLRGAVKVGKKHYSVEFAASYFESVYMVGCSEVGNSADGVLTHWSERPRSF